MWPRPVVKRSGGRSRASTVGAATQLAWSGAPQVVQKRRPGPRLTGSRFAFRARRPSGSGRQSLPTSSPPRTAAPSSPASGRTGPGNSGIDVELAVAILTTQCLALRLGARPTLSRSRCVPGGLVPRFYASYHASTDSRSCRALLRCRRAPWAVRVGHGCCLSSGPRPSGDRLSRVYSLFRIPGWPRSPLLRVVSASSIGNVGLCNSTIR
jgi:hypothetical protein